MNRDFIKRLFKTLDEMEGSIELTSMTIEKRGFGSAEILDRFNQYRAILKKQREAAVLLEQHFEECNWAEVVRSVTIIDTLSAMIRDDAAMILGKPYSGRQSVDGDTFMYQ